MNNRFMTAQGISQVKCEICGQPINHADFFLNKNRDYTVCGSIECKRIVSQKASTPPAIFNAYVKQIREQRKKEAAEKKHIEETKAREAQENQKVLQSILNDYPELADKNIYMLSIPSGLSNAVPLPAERVKNYTEHLQSIIAEASQYANTSELSYGQNHIAHETLRDVEQRFVENPGLQAMSERFCSMCKGGCCAAGKEHAYLSVFTMRYFMDTNPNLFAEDILKLYLSYICSESIENACINQTKTGCALPTELRSDNCNGFYCESLKSYQKKLADKTEMDVVLVIQRSNTFFNRFNDDQHNEIVKVDFITDENQQLTNASLKK